MTITDCRYLRRLLTADAAVATSHCSARCMLSGTTYSATRLPAEKFDEAAPHELCAKAIEIAVYVC